MGTTHSYRGIAKSRVATLLIPIVEDNTKYCPGCKKHLDKKEFNRDKTRYDGLKAWCRKCYAKQRRRWVK